jgi:hypothetical protein
MEGATAPSRPELRIKTPPADEEWVVDTSRFLPKRRWCTRQRCTDAVTMGMMSGSGLLVLGVASGQLVAMQLGMFLFVGACITSSVLHPPALGTQQ